MKKNGKYFWDSYAIILLLQGSENIKKYLEFPGYTTILNIMEVYSFLLRESMDRNVIDILLESFIIIKEFDIDLIREAAEFRLKMKSLGKNISYIDSIGYILAKKLKAKFLTGDKEFKDLENVEYIYQK
jgi:PIN domain nuclease of toxin-antitoxin system